MNKPSIIVALSIIIFTACSMVLIDHDHNRDFGCVAIKVGVSKAQFKKCFLPVRPDRNHNPDGERQRENKALLLPCLQKANPGLSNSDLDRAMDVCRPEGPMHDRK